MVTEKHSQILDRLLIDSVLANDISLEKLSNPIICTTNYFRGVIFCGELLQRSHNFSVSLPAACLPLVTPPESSRLAEYRISEERKEGGILDL